MEKFLEDAVELSRDEDLLESYNKTEADIELSHDEGFDQGVAQNRREVAKDMLKGGYNISEIVKISKLPEKEIEEIKKDLKI